MSLSLPLCVQCKALQKRLHLAEQHKVELENQLQDTQLLLQQLRVTGVNPPGTLQTTRFNVHMASDEPDAKWQEQWDGCAFQKA